MRIDVLSYYSVDRARVEFCRIRSSFDSPTVIYIAAPLPVFSSDVFGLRKPVSGCSSFLSSQSMALYTALLAHLPNPLRSGTSDCDRTVPKRRKALTLAPFYAAIGYMMLLIYSQVVFVLGQ